MVLLSLSGNIPTYCNYLLLGEENCLKSENNTLKEQSNRLGYSLWFTSMTIVGNVKFKMIIHEALISRYMHHHRYAPLITYNSV